MGQRVMKPQGEKRSRFRLRNFSASKAVDTCVEGISERDICTSDLDSHSATEILEILKRLNEDFHKTVAMVTHDPHAASYAHITRHLEKGMLLPPP